MGIVIRQSLKGTLVIYVAAVVGAVNNIWITPSLMLPEYIGVVRALIEYAFLFSAFTHLGVPFIATKFFGNFKDDAQKHKGFLPFLLLYPILGLTIFLGLYALLKNWLSDFYIEKSPILVNYYYFVIPLTVFLTYQIILETYSHLHLRIVVPNILRELLIKIGNVALVLGFGWGFYHLTGLIWANIILYALPLFFLFVYIAWLKKLYLQPKWQYFEAQNLKEMTIYGLYTIIGGLGVVIVSKIDAIMIPSLLGEKMMGIFTIPYFITLVIEIPKKALKQVSSPILAQALAQKNEALLLMIYQKTSLHLLLAGSFIFIGVWANIDEVFSIIPNEIFKQGKYIVLFLGIAKVLDMATGLNGELLLFSSHYRFVLILTLFLAILTVISNYFFISQYGLNGAGLANLTCVFAYEIIKYLYIWIYFGIQPFTNKTLYVLGIILVVCLSINFIPLTPFALLNIFIKGSIISLLFGILVITTKVSPEINYNVERLLKK